MNSNYGGNQLSKVYPDQDRTTAFCKTPYVLKQICINVGRRTSLQYHNCKQETNILFQGIARLYYLQTVHNNLLNYSSEASKFVEIEAPMTVGIVPKIVHRSEALTDIVLFEASTPHLYDVIRISEDSSRPSKRIEAEYVHE